MQHQLIVAALGCRRCTEIAGQVYTAGPHLAGAVQRAVQDLQACGGP